jgi:inosose dehydratase
MTNRMAYNPLSFVLTAEGFKPELAPPLPQILSIVREAGYDGIHSDIPAGMTPKAYLDLLAEHHLAPAPGYFQSQFDNQETLAATIETARRLAADHAQLGLNRIFIAEQFGADPRRIDIPAQGVAGDAERLSRIADGLAQVAQAMAGEGIVPCLHAHVGTRIETVEETEFVLDRIGSDILLVGPDTGHLSWAGADLNAFLTRHAARVGAVHIKDYRRDVAARINAEGQGYHAAGAAHIWTEPGRGSIDLEAALAALAGFDGWFIVEVDIADQPTVPESAVVAAQWLRPRLEARRAA